MTRVASKRAALAVALALLAACKSSESKQPEAGGKHVVGVKELPKANADLLAAYSRGGDEWEEARKDALADPKLTRFLVENLMLEMVRAHRALGGNDHVRARSAFDRAQVELVRLGDDAAVPTLVGMLEVGDSVAAEDAAAVLERIGRGAIAPVAELLARDPRETRRRAAAVLARLPHAGNASEDRIRERLIELSQSDPEWVVRAEVARALGGRGARDASTTPWRNALQAQLLDRDPAVIEAAAQSLARLGDLRAVPRLIDLLERTARSGDIRSFKAAQRALVQLTRQPEKPTVEAWRQWWSAQKTASG